MMQLEEASASSSSSPPPSKRPKLQSQDSEFLEMFDAFAEPSLCNQEETQSSIQQEASTWLKRSPQDGLTEAGISPRQLNDPTSILLLWAKAELQFPLLSRWSRFVFSIPATSASVERMWHRAKLTITPLRHALNPNLVRDELFLAINEDQV